MALTKYNYNSFDVTPVASTTMAFNSGANGLTTMSAGAMTLIKTLTASSDGTLDFVDGTDDVVLDNTYPIYKFVFTNIHPETNNVRLQFQGNAASGSGYNETITSATFEAYHNEAGTDTSLNYSTGADLAQGTGFQTFVINSGNDNDQCCSGELYLFNPSSTTFVKHFLGRASQTKQNDAIDNTFFAGYFNTTSAIDEIQFKMDSDNIDAGTIKLYGIKDS